MQAKMETTRREAAATVEEWKRKQDAEKLEQRAKDAEEYAEAATAVVTLAQEEARAAALDAIEARREAEAASQTVATAR
jgi:hypothetical protein